MKEIPQKGWCLMVGEGDFPTNIRVCLDGKQIGGIQKFTIEISAETPVPVIKMDVIPIDGLLIDGVFPSLKVLTPEKTIVFKSSQSPEEVLKTMDAQEQVTKEPEAKTEVL